MKKLIALLTVLMICISLAVPAAAAEKDFVPSISYKPAPEIVPITDENGNPAIAVLRDADGNIIAYITEDCLVITPVSEAETSTEIPEDAAKLLLELYKKILSGDMTLPYDKLEGNLDGQNMVIRDLFDASWLCEDHPELLAKDGVTMEIKFDLGVEAKRDVYAMIYVDGQWEPAVNCTNNGDGTVTCTFDEICPIVFAVEGSSDSSKTGDTDNTIWWTLAALAALAAIVVLTVVYRRSAKKAA